MSDDIIKELQCAIKSDRYPWDATLYQRCIDAIEARAAEIERLRLAGDALAAQITHPCRCVEAHDGAINETCAPCAAAFDWEEARRAVLG